MSVQRLMFNENGSIKLVGTGLDYESANGLWERVVACLKCSKGGESISEAICNGCSYCDGSNALFIPCANKWLNAHPELRGEIAPHLSKALFGKTDKVLWQRIKNLSQGLDSFHSIDHSTMDKWKIDGKRTADPRKNLNDPKPRLNMYRLCAIMGLKSKESISSFFAEVCGVKAFSQSGKLSRFEFCAEHFCEQAADDWFGLAITMDQKIEKKLRENGMEEVSAAYTDDVVSTTSFTENQYLTDDDFINGYISSQQNKALTAREKVLELRSYYAGMEEISENQVVSHILGSDKMRANTVPELKEIGASRNFPTTKILRAIINGKANEDQIRRMIVFLSFARVETAYKGETASARRNTYSMFKTECNKMLEEIGYHILTVTDGFDAFIVFCWSTVRPRSSLRNIMSGKKPA